MTETSTLSVRERIELRLEEILRAAQGEWLAAEIAAGRLDEARAAEAKVERWHEDSNEARHLDVLVITGDEHAVRGSEGSIGVTEKRLPVMVQVIVARAVSASKSERAASVHNRWIARVERAVMADPNLRESEEAGGQFLAIDIETTGTSQPPLTEDQPDFASVVVFEVLYRHPADDPYTVSG